MWQNAENLGSICLVFCGWIERLVDGEDGKVQEDGEERRNKQAKGVRKRRDASRAISALALAAFIDGRGAPLAVRFVIPTV